MKSRLTGAKCSNGAESYRAYKIAQIPYRLSIHCSDKH